MTARTPDPRASASQVEQELLARLGLGKQASTQDVETARDAIVGFLETAPQDIRAWAQREIAATDEAYALLSDPDADLAAMAAPAAVAGTSAEPPSAEAAAAIPAASRSRSAPSRSRFGPLGRVVLAGIAVVAVVGVGYTVYAAGAPTVPAISGTPAPETSGGPAIDAAQVSALMQKIQADPKDVAALTQLGNLYFNGQDYKTAEDWFGKVIAIDPKNVDATLGLAAALFNEGDSAGAEKQWRAVIAIQPRNQEAYYGLGFMYLAKDPPDMANVTAMWNKVIEIDPTTDIAKNVQTHLSSFASASPGASGAEAPSGSAAPSADTGAPSQAPSSAASPAPSASGN